MAYREDPYREQIRERLEQYLRERRNLDTSKNFKCQSGSHEDEHPSMRLVAVNNQIPTVAYCFSCHAGMDIFHFIEKYEGKSDFPAQIAWAKEHFGIGDEKGASKMAYEPQKTDKRVITQEAASNASEGIVEPVGTVPDCEALVRAWHEHINETDHHRGLSDEILKEYRVGYDPDFVYHGVKDGEPYTLKAGPSLMIPFPGESYYVARPLEPEEHKVRKYLKPQGVNPHPLFNERWLRDPADDPLFIVEGVFDALSIEDVGFHAVALVGTAPTRLKKLIRQALKKKPGKVYILSMDNDLPDKKGVRAGKVAMDNLEKELIELGARVYRPRSEDEQGNLDKKGIEGEYKDANEAYTENRQGFGVAVARAWEDALSYGEELDKKEQEEFEQSSMQSYEAGIWEEIEAEKDLKPLDTGFTELNQILGGGLYEGLFVLGAVTGFGKTTLALQIGDYVAEHGTDVIIFSLEMGRKELYAKSISRITYELDPGMALTALDVRIGSRYAGLGDYHKSLIRRARERYAKYSKHVFIYPGGIGDQSTEDMRKALTEHVRRSKCKKPLVIVDYLQIIPPDNGKTEKQNMDKAILEFKRLSRDFGIPVIVVSSFNRASYEGKPSLKAYKESGAIEYSCDVLLGLGKADNGSVEEVNLSNDTVEPSGVEEQGLYILKNRNGRLGNLSLKFIKKHNCYDE